MKKNHTPEDTFRALKRPYLDINLVNHYSFEIEGIDRRDYPDFCDAYISYAEFKDGTLLSDDQLDQLNEEHPDIVYELAFERAF